MNAYLNGNGEDSPENQLAGRTSDQRDGPQKCAACGKVIPAGLCFCRIPAKETSTFLCSPRCALRHFDKLYPKTNGDGHDVADGEHHRRIFVGEEKLWP